MNEHSGWHEYKDGKRFNPDCPACVADDRDFKKHQLEQLLAKCREDCEACADGFISTHEKATNEVRKQERERIRKQLAVVEIPKGKVAGYNVDGKQYVALAMSEENWQALKGEK